MRARGLTPAADTTEAGIKAFCSHSWADIHPAAAMLQLVASLAMGVYCMCTSGRAWPLKKLLAGGMVIRARERGLLQIQQQAEEIAFCSHC